MREATVQTLCQPIPKPRVPTSASRLQSLRKRRRLRIYWQAYPLSRAHSLRMQILISLKAWLPFGQNQRKTSTRSTRRSRKPAKKVTLTAKRTSQVKTTPKSCWKSTRNLSGSVKKRSVSKSWPRWRKSGADSRKRSCKVTLYWMPSWVKPLHRAMEEVPTLWSASGTRRPCLGTTHATSQRRRNATSMTPSGETSIVGSFREPFSEFVVRLKLS